MVFSFLLRCASTIIGAFMPAFCTFKTLAKPNQRAQVYWLKYWAVFGAALAVECALDFCLISYIIPGYEIARLLFLLYAVNPVTNGAQSLYDNLLKPVFVKHEKRIDAARKEVTASITDKVSGVVSNIGHILFSATVNRFAAIQGVATGPAMPQLVNTYNLRQSAPDSYPIIHEIKEEPMDWDEDEDEVMITKVVEPKKRNGRRMQQAPVVVEYEEQEEEEEEEIESDGEQSSGDMDFVPPPARGKSSGRGRGRGRGKGKKN